MKKVWKRALALLCALTMVVVGIMTWDGQVSEAEAEAETTEWALTLNNVGYAWSNNALDINFTSGLTKNDLTLEVEFTLTSAMASTMRTSGGRIDVEFGNYDGQEFDWRIYCSDIQAGTYKYEFKLSEPYMLDGTPDFASAFKWFRMIYFKADGTYPTDFTTGVTNLTAKVVKREATEWNIGTTAQMNGSVGYAWQNSAVGIKFPTGLTESDLALHLEFKLSQTLYNEMLQGNVITINFGNSSGHLYNWQLKAADVKEGDNAIDLPLSVLAYISGTPDISAEFMYFRILRNSEATYALTTNLTNLKAKIVKKVASEWNVNKVASIGYAWSTSNNACTLVPTTFAKDDLALEVAFNLTEDLATTMKNTGGSLKVELGTSSSATNQYAWYINTSKVQSGNNTHVLKLSKASEGADIAVGKFTWFRVYWIDGSAQGYYSDLSGMVGVTAKVVRLSPYIQVYQSSTVYGEVTGIAPTLAGNVEYAWSASGLTINFPEGVEKEDIALNVKFDLSAQMMSDLQYGNLRFELGTGNTTCFAWYKGMAALKEGTNELCLKLSEGYDGIDLSSTFTHFRVYFNCSSPYNPTTYPLTTNMTNLTAVVAEPGVMIQAGKTPIAQELNVSDVPDGYVFAGWYTDSACETKQALRGTANGTVYAKFVRGGVLGVKAQYTKNASSTYDKKGIIRFISTVDSLQYQEVGFSITIGENTAKLPSTTVYESLTAVGGKTYVPTDIDPASQYFNAILFENVPTNTPIDATVTAYWVTQDGTTVYGDARVLPTITITE